MSEMVDRVIAAMRQANGNVSDVLLRHMAYAAISAMREPSSEMVDAMLGSKVPPGEFGDHTLEEVLKWASIGDRVEVPNCVEIVYRAGIDAAMSPPPFNAHTVANP